MLVIFSGSSGAGKNTIISALLAADPRCIFMPTVTTRAMRTGESEGNPYYFTTESDFLARVQAGEFLEYERVHGNLYGTSRKILQNLLNSGKILLKDIDVLGTKNLLKHLGDKIKVVTIFVTVDEAELVARLKARGDSESDINLRLSRFEEEQYHAQNYQYTIKNHDLKTAIADVRQIIDKSVSKGRP